MSYIKLKKLTHIHLPRLTRKEYIRIFCSMFDKHTANMTIRLPLKLRSKIALMTNKYTVFSIDIFTELHLEDMLADIGIDES